MLSELLDKYKIILASNSPRRKELLSEIISPFTVEAKSIKEDFPASIVDEEVAMYLAKLKCNSFTPEKNELIITADTIVVLENKILGKPKNKEEATAMLTDLSGKSHKVITGVTLKSKEKEITFSDTTDVEFDVLSKKEIAYYIDKYKPYDKAGSYGIQEWIGYIGVKKIEGDYYNVMGLPVYKLYKELKKFT